MSHDHSTDKFKHHAHILPLKVYFGIGGALMLLTIITVAVAQVHLGPFNLIVALLVASIKAALVGLYFMHLKYDNRLYATVFVLSISFLAIFISITMYDTMRRGDIYGEVSHPIKEKAIIYDKMASDTLHTGQASSGHGESKPTH